MSFLITGFGRSGTKYLARLLARAPDWTVLHEPGTEQDLIAINARFAANNRPYGEVNSFCLAVLPKIEVGYKALLVRNPRNIFQSCVRMGHAPTPLLAHYLGGALAQIDYFHRTFYYPMFRLEDIASGITRIADVCRAVGLPEIQVDTDILARRVNKSPPDLLGVDFSPGSPITIEFERQTGWFTKQYYGDLI